MKKITAIISSLGLLTLASSPVFAEVVEVPVQRPVNLPFTQLGTLISGGVGIILILAALAAFVFLIMGGLQWITSGGDKAAVESAQHKIQAALIGLFVVFAAWAIMLVVGKILGIDLYNLRLPKLQD